MCHPKLLNILRHRRRKLLWIMGQSSSWKHNDYSRPRKGIPFSKTSVIMQCDLNPFEDTFENTKWRKAKHNHFSRPLKGIPFSKTPLKKGHSLLGSVWRQKFWEFQICWKCFCFHFLLNLKYVIFVGMKMMTKCERGRVGSLGRGRK